MRHLSSLLGAAVVALAVVALDSIVESASAEDRPGTHNMLVFGKQVIFLSHLPMFDGLDRAGVEFRSAHRYQVILEAKLSPEQQQIYLRDREQHAGTPFYTIQPDPFVISRLFTPATAPQLSSFKATVFSGHLERGGEVVPRLENIVINVARVVHGRKFDPHSSKPDRLEYLLMGRGNEIFLAHTISAPPDFDHVLQVKVIGRTLTDQELNQDIRLAIPERRNVAAQRLRTGQRVKASLQVGKGAPSDVELDAGDEIYFEEGELAQ